MRRSGGAVPPDRDTVGELDASDHPWQLVFAMQAPPATRAFLRPRRFAMFMAHPLRAKLPRLRVLIELVAS
jgi:hypothetical protein